jgi:hypothetical protein
MDTPEKRGFLFQLWQTFPKCEKCGERGPVCPQCVGGLEKWDLSVYTSELRHREGDVVDIYVPECCGWIRGTVVGIDTAFFRYNVQSEMGEIHHVVFWPDIDEENYYSNYLIECEGTNCMEDWRENIEGYKMFECIAGALGWTTCRQVYFCRTTDRVLVVVETPQGARSEWFSRNSPNIRFVWE